MASPDEQNYEECVTDDHIDDDEEEVSDDSDEDPSFDIIKGSRSKLSSLSIKKTPKPRFGKERFGYEEEKGEKDSYHIVEEVVKAGQLEKLQVEQCKVYLRKHGLRLTGNKDTLIQRIREHLDVTDGGGERKYPVSSFVMNCKGDACASDVVLFEQNVYEMFSIASRSATGPPCGTRLVAGRIVKESYGAEKQQHTFTIEVLWSTGEKPLHPLHQLLIKGRNLYRLKTMRQKWEDEAERPKMLSEKHARGHIARSNRETRVQEKEMRKMMRQLKMEDKKKPTSTYIAMNTMEAQPPQKPIENKLNNLQSHIGNVLMERHHLQYLPPGRQCLTSMNCNLPSDHPPGKATYGGLNTFNNSLNEVQRASHYASYANQNNIRIPSRAYHYGSNTDHNSIRSPSRAATYSSSSHGGYVDAHFRKENPVQGHFQEKKQQACRYFAQGRCHFGDRCKWLHEDSRIQKIH